MATSEIRHMGFASCEKVILRTGDAESAPTDTQKVEIERDEA